MQTFTVHIEDSTPEKEALKWCWETFAQFAEISYEYVSSSSANFIIGKSTHSTIKYNKLFWDKINAGKYAGNEHLTHTGEILFEDGTVDYFSTAFYFINCVWEYDTSKRDALGRSDYSQSVWNEMGLDCSINRVTEIFIRICNTLQIPVPVRESEVFLSHDIDSIYGAWKEDGKAALKQGRISAFFSGTYKHFLTKPAWYNILDIVDIEKRNHAKSTFFWLTERGRLDARRVNADYDISSPSIRKLMDGVEKAGFENGLHKSLSSTTFQQEFDKLNLSDKYNRYHYLSFSIPETYKIWTDAGLAVDCSLGYAEHFGFRNGYGLPFFPFDLTSKTTVPVLEVPLHLMDGTFSKYKNLSAEKAYQDIVTFLEKNKEHAVISILWHNSHFTDFKYVGYPDLYVRLLQWINLNGLQYTSLAQLFAKYAAGRTKSVNA